MILYVCSGFSFSNLVIIASVPEHFISNIKLSVSSFYQSESIFRHQCLELFPLTFVNNLDARNLKLDISPSI